MDSDSEGKDAATPLEGDELAVAFLLEMAEDNLHAFYIREYADTSWSTLATRLSF